MKKTDKSNKTRKILKGLKSSLNLSVDKINSMVTLRTSVFVSVSNEVLPNKRVCAKYESVDSNILKSTLFKVLRRALILELILSLNLGQWKRK